jgi:hypothetical protein
MPIQANITFPDESPDIANQLAESLAGELSGEVLKEDVLKDPDSVKVIRTDRTAQDFGTTLVLLLGTPVLLALANAVRDWAKRKDQATIHINGIKINNVGSKDVAEIVTALNHQPPPSPTAP